MSILLINPNREQAPQPVMPNGLAAVASALAANGAEVDLLDLCFERRPVVALENRLRRRPVDLVGISVRNLDNSDLLALKEYTPEIRDLVRATRKLTGATVVAGGAAFGVAPEALLDEIGVDYGIAGDGEDAVVRLVDSLAAGRAPSGPGLVWRRDGGAVLEPPRAPANLDLLPIPDLPRWLAVHRYQRRGATVPVQTKRGCVFRCVYCTYRNVEGKGYRLRSPGHVAEEIAGLQRAGVRRIEFVDSTFNSPLDHALSICEMLARLSRPMAVDTTNFTPAVTPPELFQAMRRAGFRWLGITAESASDPVLDRMRKGFDRARLEQCAAGADSVGIRVLWILLAGGPGETAATLADTLAFAGRRLARGDAVYLTVGLRIYPGTALHQIAVSEGMVSPEDRLLGPAFYFAPALPLQQALATLRGFAARYPRFMFSADSRNALLPWLTRLAGALHLPRPHWRYLALFRRLALATGA